MSKQKCMCPDCVSFRGKLKEWTAVAIMGLILGAMLWSPAVLYFMGYGV